ncbi:MAG TPA: hypothetical protein QF355_02175 [Candidatus Marinimicrobia bacterium]|nr:hypothetical protein [Candidatus Neomarinimicrobiota bacterium]
MKKIYILVIMSLLVMSCDRLVKFINGPPVDQGFLRTFGTTFYDYGWGVDETFDGGAIIVGAKEYRSDRTRDILLVKVDENGFGLWEKSFGGSNNEEGYAVKQCMDGGFILAGYSTSYGAAADIYVVKTDPYGIKEWDKVYGGNNLDRAYEIIETHDGHFIIVGVTNSPGISHGNDDIWLQKIDGQGNTVWRNAYGESNHEVGYDVVELPDGGFLVLGYKNFYDVSGKDIYLIRTDSVGTIVWAKTYGSSMVFDEIGYSIHEAYPSGYLICASTNSRDNGWFDPQVIKIDYDGNMQWSAIYNGSGRSHTRWVATPTYDGGAAIIGTTTYYHTNEGDNEDIYLIKIDQQGQELWNIGFEGGDSDWGWSIVETCINDLLIVGSTKSYGRGLFDIILMNTNEFGNYNLDG